MKLTLPWLKEHLETGASLDEIVTALTNLGLEVEDVVDRTGPLANFSVAHVTEAIQHPNADRLRLCTVETKDGTKQIVCGAPNARTGLYGIYAPTGSVIPATGDVLRPSTIRGIESQGMLCSARELGIGEEHDGIIELDHPFDVGTPCTEALGIEGPVIDIGLTPDRADCFGVRGIARDLAAAGQGRLQPLEIEPVPSPVPASASTSPRGTGRHVPFSPGVWFAACATARARHGCRNASRRSACVRFPLSSISPIM